MTRSHLVPCPSCARHVRANEGSCPFCGAGLPGEAVAPRGTPVTRLSRAALVAFGTGALALTAPAGCSSSTTSGVSGGETNYAPPYGAVPFDAAVEGEDAGLVLADAHVGTGDAAEASAADAGADAAGDAGEDATASDSGGGDGGGDAADGD